MVETQDLELLKDIPGYKAILKALIKSQIQHLVEQLSSHTDEECVLLAASLSDGSLSHLGSNSGKQFLDSHDEIKKQFLGFCLKRQLKPQSSAIETEPHIESLKANYIQNDAVYRSGSNPRRNKKGPVPVRLRPAASPYGTGRRMSKASPGKSKFPTQSAPLKSLITGALHVPISESQTGSDVVNVKLEPEITSAPTEQTDSGPQAGSQNEQFSDNDIHPPNQAGSSTSDTGEGTSVVKLEQVEDDDESDLEITGVEMSDFGNDGLVLGGHYTDMDQSAEKGLPTNVQCSLPFGASPHSNFGDMQNFENVPTFHPSFGREMEEKEKRFKCDLCNRRFFRKDYLNKHYLIHTGEKPYKCTKCQAAFRQRSHLRMHVIKHSMNDYTLEALL